MDGWKKDPNSFQICTQTLEHWGNELRMVGHLIHQLNCLVLLRVFMKKTKKTQHYIHFQAKATLYLAKSKVQATVSISSDLEGTGLACTVKFVSSRHGLSRKLKSFVIMPNIADDQHIFVDIIKS